VGIRILQRRNFMIIYRSDTNIRAVKYSMLRWAVHAACVGKARNSYNYLKDQEYDGRITLRWLLGRSVVRLGGEWN
jgi:hypothetical protein